MDKLDNLTAILEPIPDTYAETINGGAQTPDRLKVNRLKYYTLCYKRARQGLNKAEKKQFFALRRVIGSCYENAKILGYDPETVVVKQKPKG